MTKVREVYNRHWMKLEFFICVAITLFLWALWRLDFLIIVVQVEPTSLYLTQAQLDVELLGFMVATLAIIYTQLGVPRLEHVRNHPSFDMIWKTFINAIKYLAVALVTSLLVIVSDFAEYLVVFNLMALMVSGARVGRCIRILENVIKLSLMEPPVRDG